MAYEVKVCGESNGASAERCERESGHEGQHSSRTGVNASVSWGVCAEPDGEGQTCALARGHGGGHVARLSTSAEDFIIGLDAEAAATRGAVAEMARQLRASDEPWPSALTAEQTAEAVALGARRVSAWARDSWNAAAPTTVPPVGYLADGREVRVGDVLQGTADGTVRIIRRAPVADDPCAELQRQADAVWGRRS